MSASLVGSEMCIRDRSACHRLRSSAGVMLPRTWAQVVTAGAGRSWITCLLYTSDAADDMHV
eukprot:14831875-Alexandrium_andersonii.AAC.1